MQLWKWHDIVQLYSVSHRNSNMIFIFEAFGQLLSFWNPRELCLWHFEKFSKIVCLPSCVSGCWGAVGCRHWCSSQAVLNLFYFSVNIFLASKGKKFFKRKGLLKNVSFIWESYFWFFSNYSVCPQKHIRWIIQLLLICLGCRESKVALCAGIGTGAGSLDWHLWCSQWSVSSSPDFASS